MTSTAAPSSSSSNPVMLRPHPATRDRAASPHHNDGHTSLTSKESPLHPQNDDSARATKASQPRGYMHFVAGGIGGMCGAIVTSPLDVVKTRLQSDMYSVKNSVASSQKVLTAASHRRTDGSYMQPGRQNMATRVKRLAYHFVETGHLLGDIAKNEGFRALFRGLGPTLVGVIPARSINFYTYGNGKIFIAEHFNRGQESSAVHLSAAAGAGIVTATATNPIWVVKTRLQLQHNEAQRLAAAEKRSLAASDAKLARSSSPAHHSPSPLKSFSTVASRHATARSTQYGQNGPALASSSSPSSLSYFRRTPSPPRPEINSLRMTLHIVRAEGIAGLYKGMSASYLGVAEGTIQWVLYEQFKRFAARRTSDTLETGQQPSAVQKWVNTVGAASTAKLIASLITYPHEVLRTRLRQEVPVGQLRKYTGLVQTMKVIMREEGIASFYGGLSAHLLRVVPNAAIMFFVYETMLNLG